MDFTQYVPAGLLVFLFFGAIDWLLGIAAGIKTSGHFSFQRLPDQLANVFLPYLTPIVAALVAAPVTGHTDWQGAILVPIAAATAKLAADVIQKVEVLVSAAAVPAPSP